MQAATEVSKTLLVILALKELGGDADLEHIAVKAHEMFPEQFCWRSFPQFPDKDAVRVHLSEAKKPNFGALVTDVDLREQSRPKEGYTKRFILTAAGLARAAELKEALDFGTKFTARRSSLDYKRVVEPILVSEAFGHFRNGADIRLIDRDSFLAAFKLFPDAHQMLIVGRMARAETAIDKLPKGDEKSTLQRFLKEGRHVFGF